MTYKAQQVGYDPQVILSGRVVNDHMPNFIADRLLNTLNHLMFDVPNSHILILGYTFKENCNDVRNTKVHDLAVTLSNSVNIVNIFDPLMNNEQVNSLSDINFIDYPEVNKYSGEMLTTDNRISFAPSSEQIVVAFNSITF